MHTALISCTARPAAWAAGGSSLALSVTCQAAISMLSSSFCVMVLQSTTGSVGGLPVKLRPEHHRSATNALLADDALHWLLSVLLFGFPKVGFAYASPGCGRGSSPAHWGPPEALAAPRSARPACSAAEQGMPIPSHIPCFLLALFAACPSSTKSCDDGGCIQKVFQLAGLKPCPLQGRIF